jgi:hypothetical protein
MYLFYQVLEKAEQVVPDDLRELVDGRDIGFKMGGRGRGRGFGPNS